MSYYEHKGEKLEIFGAGGGQRVSEQLTGRWAMTLPRDGPAAAGTREVRDRRGRPAGGAGRRRRFCVRMAWPDLPRGWLNGCWQVSPRSFTPLQAALAFKSGSLLVGESLGPQHP